MNDEALPQNCVEKRGRNPQIHPTKAVKSRPTHQTEPETSGSSVLARLAETDGRVTGGGKFGVDHVGELLAWGIFRWAVLRAVVEGDLSRDGIAAKLGVRPKRLEKWLTPSDPARPAFGKVFRLFHDRTILPQAVRRRALLVLMHELGLIVVDEAMVGDDSGSVERKVLQVDSAHGRLTTLLCDATSNEGDGGEAITPTEAAKLIDAVLDERMYLSAMKATLIRLVG